MPTKHDETGEMISCISAPSIVATQLEQMGAQPGHKVLGAGATTGYNARLETFSEQNVRVCVVVGVTAGGDSRG